MSPSALVWIRLIALTSTLAATWNYASPKTAQANASLLLRSPDFTAGGVIPKKFTCNGADVSPALTWQSPPEKTKTLAVTITDIDSPMPVLYGHFVHWVLYDMPPGQRSLAQNVPGGKRLVDGARQGINGFHHIGYGGPCPPGNAKHRYVFAVYALDAKLALPPGATKKQLDSAIAGHVIAAGRLLATYR